MKRKEIFRRVRRALRDLFHYDSELFENLNHEQTVTSCLACHLKPRFPRHHVDVEYDRRGQEVKQIRGQRIRPDIIIHQRGNQSKNLAAIEVKWATHGDTELLEAMRKVYSLVFLGRYRYRVGYVLVIDRERKCAEIVSVERREQSGR